MAISEWKMKIVIENYFKAECNVNTSIREAFEKGFRIGVNKALSSVQQWIPCSERLPKKAYGKYWVCTDMGYQCQCRWTNNVCGLGVNGEWTWNRFDIPQFTHVVAWMPLPESYKDSEQDESL